MPIALEMPYLLLTALTIFVIGMGAGILFARHQKQNEPTAPGAKNYHLWLDSSGSMSGDARALSGGLEALGSIQDEAHRTYTSITVTVQAFSHVPGSHTLELTFDPRDQPINMLEVLDDLDDISRSVGGGTDIGIVYRLTPAGMTAIVVTDMEFVLSEDQLIRASEGRVVFRAICDDNADVLGMALLGSGQYHGRIQALTTRSTGAWVEAIKQQLSTSAQR